MAVSIAAGGRASDAQTLLLDDALDGAVDYRGQPVYRSRSGGWRSASFIIGVEVAERFAYYGIASNLISYLTGPLGQSTAVAAENVNVWSGAASLLPLVGAYVADSFLGRYQTIIVASVLYILGLGLLTLSAILPFVSLEDCQSSNGTTSCSPPRLQVIFFFVSLYVVAVAQGGHKPCVQAFGADQFDGQDPDECKAKSSFFNWWYFALCSGTLVALSILNYIQDNLNWGLGFGIPCIAMAIALAIFLLGTTTYRFSIKRDGKNPFSRIIQVFIVAAKNWRTTTSAITIEEEACGTLPSQGSLQFKFLNKALLAPDGSKEEGKVCSRSEVEDAKSILRLIPIWATSLIYATVFAQSSTFFTKQGITMDRAIGSGFDVPAASLQSFISLSIVLFIPIYDRIFIPIARSFTRKPSGITMLQRIGTGIFFSVISMLIAALVEMKRLKTAQEHGLVDVPRATVPMSVWWLIPQYLLFGVGDVFTMVGLQEFFYDQVPNELRSVGLSLYLSIFGVGSFLSSFLISIIERATGGDGQDSWFADNLNRAHLDYFYWLLCGLSAVGLVAFLYFSKSYIYSKGSAI
ncbi:protein NRT1/ PTR FAMILY 5.10-like [Malania oleifera]|uniref:protein NRT1/ PTR FAMILY 5.10-like n=1 Tax=Malania oleifera TaxID=397392 RepID=UPI0025AE6B08|nr:protein NRT1/ PTR FAMILY 5.10-like [Malania oleifera]